VADGFFYIIKPDDSPSKIAKRFGLASWKTIWNHGKNKEFRKERNNNQQLIYPGERVWITGALQARGAVASGGRGRFVAPPAKTRKVVQIKARVQATQSARGTYDIAPPKTHHEFISKSSDKAMASNKPTVLVRNCSTIVLEAETDPANQKDVRWSVIPNPIPNTSMPLLIRIGTKVFLSTDASGGYSIAAYLGRSVVYWNVVLVDVKVRKSRIRRHSSNFKDRSSPGQLSVSSGQFAVGQPAKCAMHVRVKVTFTAGGKKSLDKYCDKAHAGIVNCLLSTTAKARYAGGGKVRERIPSVAKGLPFVVSNPATKVTDLGYPVLDRGGAEASRATGGNTIFLSKTRSRPARGTKRTVESCDSPAVGFPSLLPEHGKAATKKVNSNTGVNAFKIYLAAYSDDAKYSYVALGHGLWTADYSGTVAVGAPGNKPVWTKGASAGIKGAGRSLTIIKSGNEAKSAGCEVRPPVYLTYILDAR